MFTASYHQSFLPRSSSSSLTSCFTSLIHHFLFSCHFVPSALFPSFSLYDMNHSLYCGEILSLYCGDPPPHPSCSSFSVTVKDREISRGLSAQERNSQLKDPLKPLDSNPSQTLTSPFHCDLPPFTLPQKQTGRDPPLEGRSHCSFGTRREEKNTGGNLFPKTEQVVFSHKRKRVSSSWLKTEEEAVNHFKLSFQMFVKRPNIQTSK